MITSSSPDDARVGLADQTSTAIAPDPAAAGLQGRLGVPGLIAAVLAFTAPLGGVAGYVALVIASGNGLGAPVTFLVVGLMVLVFSVGYIKMTRLVPNPGGFYSYVAAGLGREIGLGTGLLTAFGYTVGVFGFAVFGGNIASSTVHVQFGGPEFPWWVYTFGFVLVGTTLTYRSIEASVRVMMVVMALEVGIVLVFDLAVSVRGGPTGRSLEPFALHSVTSGSVPIAALFAFLLFVGFEVTTLYREEVKDPVRTIRRSTYLSVIFIAVFYAFSAWCMITAFGVNDAVDQAQADPSGFFFTGVQTYLGSTMLTITSLLLITSVFACLLSYGNSVCRYLYSMGKDGVLPRRLGEAHPRRHSPHRAALTLGAVSATLTAVAALCGFPPNEVFTWALFVAGVPLLSSYVLASASVVVYFLRKRGSADVTRGNVVLAVAAFLALSTMLVLALLNPAALVGQESVVNSLIPIVLLAILMLGIMYGFYLRNRKPDVYRSIGRQS
ncbi:APC family permease [Rhodococcus sp. NPDC057014]|uniref:APC family permease n=1 Tax=Rhodococcus sp. NPDC057014 TaxID=3346000 RepID=UPI00363B3EAF